jgi:hypothetical protein
MPETLDTLGAKIDGLVTRIDDLDTGLSGRIDGLATRIDDLDTRLSGRIDGLAIGIDDLDTRLSGRIDALDTRLSGQIDDLDTRLSGRIDTLDTRVSGRFDDLQTRVSGKIDDVKITLLIRIEAVDGKVDLALEKIDRLIERDAVNTAAHERFGQRLDNHELDCVGEAATAAAFEESLRPLSRRRLIPPAARRADRLGWRAAREYSSRSTRWRRAPRERSGTSPNPAG